MLYILTGPSCAGKTTAMNQVLAGNPNLRRLITATTRPQRPDEPHDAYYFLSNAAFNALQQSAGMYAVNDYAGHKYGIPAVSLDDLLVSPQGVFDYITVLDVTGAAELKSAFGESVRTIFLYAPLRVIAERLRERGDKDANRRIAKAAEELAATVKFDVIVYTAGSVAETVCQVAEIVRARRYLSA
jgi:guanylate kinase